MRLLLIAGLLAGCGAGSLSPLEQTQRCTDLADVVATAGLDGTPTEQVAKQVATSLDNKLSRLGAPAVHEPAVRLHQLLHGIESAQHRGDSEQAGQAAQKARDAIADLAAACELPASRFLGSVGRQ